MIPADTDQTAQERLLRTFPDVPVRIIATVFTAYRQVEPTLADTVHAVRARIADACALE